MWRKGREIRNGFFRRRKVAVYYALFHSSYLSYSIHCGGRERRERRKTGMVMLSLKSKGIENTIICERKGKSSMRVLGKKKYICLLVQFVGVLGRKGGIVKQV